MSCKIKKLFPVLRFANNMFILLCVGVITNTLFSVGDITNRELDYELSN